MKKTLTPSIQWHKIIVIINFDAQYEGELGLVCWSREGGKYFT